MMTITRKNSKHGDLLWFKPLAFPRTLAIALLCLPLALTGCASSLQLVKPGPDFDDKKLADLRASIAPEWIAQTDRVAHGANSENLKTWWQQLGDPVLVQLIENAQGVSANLAQTAQRIAEARAGLAVIDASKLPTLDATASQSRAAFTFGGPVALRTQLQAQLQTSWELDLFGRRFREREAALARAQARVLDWHDGRVVLAAEVANAYVQYRFCEQQVAVLTADAQSRSETSRLTELAANAGFQPPSSAAVLRASAADARRRVIIQKGDCQVALKSLVSLTAVNEPELIKLLQPNSAKLPQLKNFAVPQIPAQALMQRPDLWAAELELAATSADIGFAMAQRYPRLSLVGAIGPVRFVSGGTTINATTWSFGPSVSVPLFDGGRSKANIELAKSAYASSEINYKAKTRNAVREVEEALVRIAIDAQRETDTNLAAKEFKSALGATEAKWKAGIGSLLELEEARRQSLSADVEVGVLKRDALLHWIALYRAVGGGWEQSNSNQ